MSTRDDLALIQATLQLTDTFVTAKESRGQPGHDEQAVEDASAALNKHRVYWRSIREHLQLKAAAEWANDRIPVLMRKPDLTDEESEELERLEAFRLSHPTYMELVQGASA